MAVPAMRNLRSQQECTAETLPAAVRSLKHPLHPTAGLYAIEAPLSSNSKTVWGWWESVCRWLGTNPEVPLLGVGMTHPKFATTGRHSHFVAVRTEQDFVLMVGILMNGKTVVPLEMMCGIAYALGWHDSPAANALKLQSYRTMVLKPEFRSPEWRFRKPHDALVA